MYFIALVKQNKIYGDIPQVVILCTERGALELLGEGLLLSIFVVVYNSISQSQAEEWLAAWQSVPNEGTELEIPVRILAAAVEWKKTRDVRALLVLPIEERRILESMLPKPENEDSKP